MPLQCPTCGATGVETATCHRCHTDLREVQAVERAAAWYRKQARNLLSGTVGHTDAHRARALAERACALHRSHESLALLAIVALVQREFDAAFRIWREVRGRRADGHGRTHGTDTDEGAETGTDAGSGAASTVPPDPKALTVDFKALAGNW